MISNTTLTVKQAVESGVAVCLTEILDEFCALKSDGVYDDIAQSICATHVATEYGLTQKQGQDIVHYSLTKMGVQI